MLELADAWVWDFWPCIHNGETHLFFLYAPRDLGDPDLRHVHARVGHAVSRDGRAWELRPEALGPQTAPAFDDVATWTGCCVADPDGGWLMFTSGVNAAGAGAVQAIGVSHSTDLDTWSRSEEVVAELDPRWYRRRPGSGPDEHWRDPFVVADDMGLWHLYLTAQVPGESGHGVVGHATSSDLRSWEVGPPLSAATGRFDQIEVISLVHIEGRWALIFSCASAEMPDALAGSGGVWSVPVEGPGARVDIASAIRLTSEALYVGRVIEDDLAQPWFLAFENYDVDGEFVGRIIDPVPIAWNRDHTGLRLSPEHVPEHWLP